MQNLKSKNFFSSLIYIYICFLKTYYKNVINRTIIKVVLKISVKTRCWLLKYNSWVKSIIPTEIIIKTFNYNNNSGVYINERTNKFL